MKTLTIDTSASLCAAAVHNDEAELGRAVLDIGKGHAEHLMAVIEGALEASGQTYADMNRIAVAIGPGSFTGIRVGVATARGLALALKIPAIGVDNLEAVALGARQHHAKRAILTAFASAQGAVQAAVYDPLGAVAFAPAILTLPEAAQLAVEHDAIVTGSAAPAIIELEPSLISGGTAVTADIAIYARLAASRQPGEKPKPLYLREPDAKPQAGFILPRAS